MIEILVIVALLGYIGWKEYNSRKERDDLMDRIMSKDIDDLAKIKIVKQTKIKSEPEPEPDLISVDNMDVDSKEFESVMKQDNG